MDHGRHQIAAPLSQGVGHPPQQVAALGGRPVGPPRLRAGGGLDHPVHFGGPAGDRGGGSAPLPGDDPAGPFPVGGQYGVGVGLVEEAPGGIGGLGWLTAVLASARGPPHRPPAGNRGPELGRLGLERGAAGPQAEQVVDEVLLRGVLLQAAEQVADGHVEVLVGHRRRVQQHSPAVGAQQLGLGGSHAFEHLELDSGPDPAPFGQQVGPGDIEQVVAGYADSHRGGALRRQRPVEAALVVGVGLGLGPIGRLGPAADGGLHPLHGQVGPLDQADLDRAGAAPVGGQPVVPVDQSPQSLEGVGQVGLHRDAEIDGRELGLAEQGAEGVGGELEVVVLLHVEVDERRRRAGRGRSHQRAQGLHHPLQRPVEVPGVELRDHRRDLHRHVVHVGLRQRVEHLPVPPAGLGVAQHGLAEHVDVERVALGGAGLHVGAQPLGLGIDHEVADQRSHAPPGHRHHQTGELPAEAGAEANQQPVQRRQERGQFGFAHQRRELASGGGRVLGADHPVHEPHGEGGAGPVAHHVCQAPGGRPVAPRHRRGARCQPALDALDGLVGQQFGVVGVAVHASLAPSCGAVDDVLSPAP